MEEKNTLVEQYIITMVDGLNKQYHGIVSEEKKRKAIEMYTNSDKNFEMIVEELKKISEELIKDYLIKLEARREQEKKDERNSRTFEQIKATQVKVQQLLDSYGMKIFISGGSVPYLLLNEDSNRLHDDIDTVCKLEDMDKLREIFKQVGLYQSEWDSKNISGDGKDYGFEMKIDGVPVGIYPFSYENGILTQYSYDPYNTQCKIKTLPLEQLSDYVVSYRSLDGKVYDTMSLEFIKMTKDSAQREKDIADSLKITQTGMLRPEVMERITMFTEIQNIEANKPDGKLIQMNPQLESIMSELVETSLLSSEQAMQKYIPQPEYQEHMKQVQEQRAILLSKILEIRKNNPTLTDGDFYKRMIISFLTPVVSQIQTQYGQVLPPEKLAKINGLLNPENIVFTNDKNKNDIQADSLTGRLIINPQKTGGTTIEEKIISSMGASIHESFHLMVNMLKKPEQAEQLGERLMYKVATSDGEKEVHFAPGKYGQVLSEGFVEKLSSEFAQKNGFYHTLNPSYIPCVKLCGEFMRQDSSIDERFLFTKSGDDIVNKMSPNVKSKFEESERLFVFNNFEAKEIKKDESLKGISSENVVSSWMERKDKVQEVKQNESFKRPFEIKKQVSIEPYETQAISSAESKKEPEFTSFKKKKEERQVQQQNINVMLQPKQEVHQQLKQATEQHNQTRQMEKSKGKTLTKPTNSFNSSSNGFVNTLILTLVTGFVAGALFMIAYYIFK